MRMNTNFFSDDGAQRQPDYVHIRRQREFGGSRGQGSIPEPERFDGLRLRKPSCRAHRPSGLSKNVVHLFWRWFETLGDDLDGREDDVFLGRQRVSAGARLRWA